MQRSFLTWEALWWPGWFPVLRLIIEVLKMPQRGRVSQVERGDPQSSCKAVGELFAGLGWYPNCEGVNESDDGR